MKKFLASAITLPVLVSAASAQCSMCYASAQHAGAGGQHALVRAIVILLFPALGLMCGIVGFAFKYGHDRDQATSE